MLERSTKLRRRCTEKGSVLLAVVVMTMFLMSFATIALSVVQYTTGRTSENVQSTQAKITAEAALTEFINSNMLSADDLKALAAGRTYADPLKIKVGIDGKTDDDFATAYGATELRLYEISSGFKVEAVTTFSTQTETASVIFDSVRVSPSEPSNCLETNTGADHFASGAGNTSIPMFGSIKLERNPSRAGEPWTIKLGNGRPWYAHIFTDFNLLMNTDSTLNDVTNVSRANGADDTNSFFKHTGDKLAAGSRYADTHSFQQAPTLYARYLGFTSGGLTIKTAVGKTDKNGLNSNDNGYVPSQLGNFDGYIMCDKLVCGKGDALHVGEASSDHSKDIDVYCYGAYLGGINGVSGGFAGHTFPDIADVITPELSGIMNNGGLFEQYGNFYCYTGVTNTANHQYQSGDLVLHCTSSSPTSLKIHGDLVVEGNIFMHDDESIAVDGSIFIGGSIITNSGTYASLADYQAAKPGKVTAGSQFSGDPRTTGTHERTSMPDTGYEPLTSHGDGSGTKLADYYAEASANDIFDESLKLNADAQQIAQKYATAMSRDLDSTYDHGAGAQPVSTRKRIGDDVIFDVYASTKLTMTTYGANPAHGWATEAYSFTELAKGKRLGTLNNAKSKKPDGTFESDSEVNNASSTDWANGKGVWKQFNDGCSVNFIVHLTDRDIVLCLPYDQELGASIRIDTSGMTGGEHFVYFMYYDKSDELKCYYLDQHQILTRNATDKKTGTAETSNRPNTVVTKEDGTTVALKAAGVNDFEADPASGTYPRLGEIKIGAANNANAGANTPYIVADYELFGARGAITPESTIHSGKNDVVANKNVQNHVMHLIPNSFDVKISNDFQVPTQGVIYALHSDVYHHTQNDTDGLLGQIKCRAYHGDGQADKNMISDCPMAGGSLVSYAATRNATSSAIKIQYYEF